MVVRLNNEIIASEVFSDETAQRTTLKIYIPPGVLRYGENHLVISGNLIPYDSCDVEGLSEYYLTIENNTRLHIPVSDIGSAPPNALVDLQFFPNLFITESDLGNIAFVLPKGARHYWDIAVKLAYSLGEESNASISNLTAVYADSVPESVLSDKHLILVGRSSALPILKEINDKLPAPFDFATDTASEQQSQVIYRLPPGANVGYLEILVSPFNTSNAMLIVSGNTETGVTLSGDTLIVNDLKRQLAGLFAVTNGTQVKTSQVLSPYGLSVSQTSIEGEVVAGAEEVVAISVPDLTAPSLERPSWLNIFITASAVLAVGILAIALAIGVRKSRS